MNANSALIECYEKQDQEAFKGKENATANVCIAEQNKVKEILRSNQLNMTRLVKEKVLLLKAAEQRGLSVAKDFKTIDEEFDYHK